MGNTGFQFDPRQQYQLDAIAAVVDLFDGQPRDADKLNVAMRGTAGETAEGQLVCCFRLHRAEDFLPEDFSFQ